jgi:hypothetical protein
MMMFEIIFLGVYVVALSFGIIYKRKIPNICTRIATIANITIFTPNFM